jgi:hypothetical protein
MQKAIPIGFEQGYHARCARDTPQFPGIENYDSGGEINLSGAKCRTPAARSQPRMIAIG